MARAAGEEVKLEHALSLAWHGEWREGSYIKNQADSRWGWVGIGFPFQWPLPHNTKRIGEWAMLHYKCSF